MSPGCNNLALTPMVCANIWGVIRSVYRMIESNAYRGAFYYGQTQGLTGKYSTVDLMSDKINKDRGDLIINSYYKILKNIARCICHNLNNQSKELILSIDAGTQSIRAALIDLNGNILHIVKTPIQPYFSEHPGWAEQQPDYYWDVFCKTTSQLL